MSNTPSQIDANAYRWHPTRELAEQSNLRAFLNTLGLASYQDLLALSNHDPDRFWRAVLDFADIRFFRPYDAISDLSRGLPWARWCVGGTTNVVLNVLDRHIEEGRGGATAITWVAETGGTRVWTYDELNRQTCRIAAGLDRLGCRSGDVVALYLPTVPEAVATLLAVAKLGAVVLPLFSGFGAESVATRVNAAGARFIVCADGTRRRGKTIAMKPVIDEAMAAMPSVAHVVVLESAGVACDFDAKHDVSWKDFLDGMPEHFPTKPVDAEAPLLIMYTSGTTGLPKGAVHTHCGFLAKMALDYIIFNDIKNTDRWLWMSDLGWFVVPAKIVGAFLAGASIVLAEGVPDYPASDRLLQIVSDQRVSVFGMSPTVARMLRAAVNGTAPRQDLSALRIIISGGEPWDTPTWEWVMQHMCHGVAPILNHCGGTELGALVLCSILDPMNPGGFSGPSPGTGADIVDAQGHSVGPGEVGELVMRNASMGTTRGLWRDPERYLESYWSRIPGVWVQGDLASRDELGIWYVHGRSDDTLKIAGKRMGPAEIETALLVSGEIIEAAAVAVADPIKGSALVCVVVPKPGLDLNALGERLKKVVVQKLGSSYAPREVLFVDELPKNRTNKLVRRLVRNALMDETPGDLSSIVNPEVVGRIRAGWLQLKDHP
jgi:acetyl-CoA synthetase